MQLAVLHLSGRLAFKRRAATSFVLPLDIPISIAAPALFHCAYTGHLIPHWCTVTTMGYRQQFFVAAKVKDKYRMLAIVHHQWIYGRTSLRQCLSILKILSAPGNLPGIHRELAQAAASVSALTYDSVEQG